MEPEDKEILKNGTVDYIGLSYYMTNAVKADHVVEGTGLDGFPGSVPNPHVKASDWGWQIDPDWFTLCVKFIIRALPKAVIYR